MKMSPVELIITDGPAAVALALSIEKQFATKPTTAVGWCQAFGFLASSPAMAVATVVDAFHDQSAGPVSADKILTALGIDPNGVLGQVENLAMEIHEQIAGGSAPSVTPPTVVPKPVPPVPAPTAPPTSTAPPAAKPPATGPGGPAGTIRT